MSDVPPVSGLVLAGGRSRRMGSDKALLKRGAGTQLAYAVALLERFLERVYVSTRADQADEPERRRYRQITDRYENLGPVAGVLSAMDREPDSAWLVLACDLPNVDDTTLATLLAERDPARPFTAYRSSRDDLPEPLCAIFEPSARAIIDDFVARGIHCPRKMQIQSDTRLIEQPDPASLDNVNTPDDLADSRLEKVS